MNLNQYMKQFSESKMALSLPEASAFVSYLLDHECKIKIKYRHGLSTHYLYVKEKYINVVCEELYRELQNASPWEDYREIIARLEWPYMHRVCKHIFENKYNGPYGEKWKEADAWFVEMWTAYHILYSRMPGFTQNTVAWFMYEKNLEEARKKTSKYRRNL